MSKHKCPKWKGDGYCPRCGGKLSWVEDYDLWECEHRECPGGYTRTIDADCNFAGYVSSCGNRLFPLPPDPQALVEKVMVELISHGFLFEPEKFYNEELAVIKKAIKEGT